MAKYYSHLLVLEGIPQEGLLCKGRGWQVGLEPNPSAGVCTRHLTGPPEPAKEIVIHAMSIERAQHVIDLVCSAHCALTGELELPEPPRAVSKRAETAEDIEREILSGGTAGQLGLPHLPAACLIAAKASHRRTYQYALFKYVMSHRSVPLRRDALDPQRCPLEKWVSSSPADHVFNAFAIMSAYSVVEELRLEIRASSQKPSKINGAWNPPVKESLEKRLRSAHINLSKRIIWHLRDTPTRIERERRLPSKQKCDWSYSRIRDVYMEVIDAINEASWLRSHVSAHKLDPLAGSLTVCDVANVQHLARRLLLEVLGFWPPARVKGLLESANA